MSDNKSHYTIVKRVISRLNDHFNHEHKRTKTIISGNFVLGSDSYLILNIYYGLVFTDLKIYTKDITESIYKTAQSSVYIAISDAYRQLSEKERAIHDTLTCGLGAAGMNVKIISLDDVPGGDVSVKALYLLGAQLERHGTATGLVLSYYNIFNDCLYISPEFTKKEIAPDIYVYTIDDGGNQ